MEVLFGNIEAETICAAIIGGVLLAIVAAVLLPEWIVSHIPEHYPIGWLSALTIWWVGFVFYVLQTIGAAIHGDPLYPRIVGRYTLWLLMGTAYGISLRPMLRYVRRHRHPNRRERP